MELFLQSHAKCLRETRRPLRTLVGSDLLDHERDEEGEVAALDLLGGFERRHLEVEVVFHPRRKPVVDLVGDDKIISGSIL